MAWSVDGVRKAVVVEREATGNTVSLVVRA